MSPEAFTVEVVELTTAAAALEPDAVATLGGQVLDAQLDELGAAVQAHVRAAARPHYRTGRLDAAIRVGHSGGPGLRSVVEVTAGDVANLIVGGTRPHDIRSLHGGALSLAGAAIPYAASVHHPGTRADGFVAEGIRRSAGDVQQSIDRAGAVIVDRLADSAEG